MFKVWFVIHVFGVDDNIKREGLLALKSFDLCYSDRETMQESVPGTEPVLTN